MLHFTLRNFRADDLDSLVKHANSPAIARNLTNIFPSPYTKAAGEGFIQMARSAEPHRIRAIVVEGKAAGAIGIHPQEDIFCKNAELGYWLGEAFWGQGIMTQAVIETVAYGFLHWEIDRIFARPFGSNVGSQRVLEKAGFELEVRLKRTIFKNGKYEDECVYAVRRNQQK